MMFLVYSVRVRRFVRACFHNRKCKYGLLILTFILAFRLKGEPITYTLLTSRIIEALGDDTMYDITHSE